jgi:hypothetical protein
MSEPYSLTGLLPELLPVLPDEFEVLPSSVPDVLPVLEPVLEPVLVLTLLPQPLQLPH